MTLITFVARDKIKVKIRKDALSSSCTLWRTVFQTSTSTEFRSNFDSKHLEAFAHLASIGSVEHIFTTHSFELLFQALGPIFAFHATGLLSYVLFCLQQHSVFDSLATEFYIQNIILRIDRHGIELPKFVMHRLAKTIIGCAWPGMPYMWKITHLVNGIGFNIRHLRTSTLIKLLGISNGASQMNIVTLILKERCSTIIQGAWRQNWLQRKYVVHQNST